MDRSLDRDSMDSVEVYETNVVESLNIHQNYKLASTKVSFKKLSSHVGIISTKSN